MTKNLKTSQEQEQASHLILYLLFLGDGRDAIAKLEVSGHHHCLVDSQQRPQLVVLLDVTRDSQVVLEAGVLAVLPVHHHTAAATIHSVGNFKANITGLG